MDEFLGASQNQAECVPSAIHGFLVCFCLFDFVLFLVFFNFVFSRLSCSEAAGCSSCVRTPGGEQKLKFQILLLPPDVFCPPWSKLKLEDAIRIRRCIKCHPVTSGK